jgi:hypothetical protein
MMPAQSSPADSRPARRPRPNRRPGNPLAVIAAVPLPRRSGCQPSMAKRSRANGPTLLPPCAALGRHNGLPDGSGAAAVALAVLSIILAAAIAWLTAANVVIRRPGGARQARAASRICPALGVLPMEVGDGDTSLRILK